MTSKGSESDRPIDRLAFLRAKKRELIAACEEELLWYRDVASFLCSCEEKQRIIGDFEEHCERLARIEQEIWRIERLTTPREPDTLSDSIRLERELDSTLDYVRQRRDKPDI
jgi:hypothetical protein